MFVTRLIVISILIVAILVAYNPQVRAGVSHAWEEARPDVVAIMDGMYAVVRGFVAGDFSPEGIHNDPPAVDYDLIIT